MAEEEKFDREVRAKLKDQEAEVPAHLWEQISQTLPSESSRGASPWKWWTGGALGILLLSAVLYFTLHTSDITESKNENIVNGNSSDYRSGASTTSNKDIDSASLTSAQKVEQYSTQSGIDVSSPVNANVSGSSTTTSVNNNVVGSRIYDRPLGFVSAGQGGDPGFMHIRSNTSGSVSNISSTGANTTGSVTNKGNQHTSANAPGSVGGNPSSSNTQQHNTGNTVSTPTTTNSTANQFTGNTVGNINSVPPGNVTQTTSGSPSIVSSNTTGTNASGMINNFSGSSTTNASTPKELKNGSITGGNTVTSANVVGGVTNNTTAGNVSLDGSSGSPATISGGVANTSGEPNNNTSGSGDTNSPAQTTLDNSSVVASTADSSNQASAVIDSAIASIDSVMLDSSLAKVDTTSTPQKEKSEKEKKDKQHTWSAEGYVGGGYGVYGLQQNPDAAPVDSMGTIYMQSRFASDASSNKITFSGGLRVNYQLSERFEVHGGIRYQQYQQAYDYNVQRFDSIYFAASDTDYVNPLRHYTPIPYSGKEKTTFISIPLGVTYKHALNDKVSLYGRGAMELMLVKSSGWVAYDTVRTVYLRGEPTSSFNVGVYLSAGAQYKLKEHWFVFAEPYCAFTLKNMYSNTDLVKQKPSAYGLMVGVRYEF